MNWNLLLLTLSTQNNQILLWESFTDIHLWILLTLNKLLEFLFQRTQIYFPNSGF